MDIVFVVIGILSITAGVFGKNFYAADVISLHAYKQRSSTWSGRLVFILVGVLFIALGITFYVRAK
jgi:hypothetical protein